jgi:zinc D-Ala-D-Ala carboxypeptidase
LNDILSLGITHEILAARGLRPYAEADIATLETVAVNDEGRVFQLIPAAAEAWRAMQRAAADDGYTLIVQSAFRSVARQIELIEARLRKGDAIDLILTSIAPPGYSEHHTGRAVDIASRNHPELDESFADTPEYAWLTANAGQFGFTLSYPRGNPSGYVYEPWHWCWS